METDHSDHPAPAEAHESAALTWGILTGTAVLFLVWGLLLFFLLGDKGPPGWDFSVIPDIPGESAYSTQTPFRPHGLVPGPYPGQVEPQHVLGPTSPTQKTEASK